MKEIHHDREVIGVGCNNEEHDVSYSHKYDSLYCPDCNEWSEDRCKDPGCPFCVERPDRPLE